MPFHRCWTPGLLDTGFCKAIEVEMHLPSRMMVAHAFNQEEEEDLGEFWESLVCPILDDQLYDFLSLSHLTPILLIDLYS